MTVEEWQHLQSILPVLIDTPAAHRAAKIEAL
jgi:hypothetical protein